MQAQGQKSADGLAPQRVVLSSRAHLSASHLKTKTKTKSAKKKFQKSTRRGQGDGHTTVF